MFKWKWIRYLHIPAILWGISIEIFNFICPLTPLEIYFRNLANGTTYSSGFIEHYIMPIVYPPGLTESIQLLLAIALIIINVSIYTYFYTKK